MSNAPKKPPPFKSSNVHPQPKNLPKIDGPFATKSSRSGGTSKVVTKVEELQPVIVKNLYESGKLKLKEGVKPKVEWKEGLNERLALWRGDITTLQVDALVNAANRRLTGGGGGVDGAIHRAAGEELAYECSTLPIRTTRGPPSKPYEVRIEAGECVITAGYNLPAKHVIHTCGPDLRKPIRDGNLPATPEQHRQQLFDSYQNSLRLAEEKKLKSVAFSAISVGVFAFPLEEGTRLALNTIRSFLDSHNSLELVVLTVFDQKTVDAYASLIPEYFPPPPPPASTDATVEPDTTTSKI